MAISTVPIGIGAGWPKNSSGSPLPMRSRSSAIATTPPERRTLKTSRIDAAPSRRATWGSPSRIAWVSIGMMWTPWALPCSDDPVEELLRTQDLGEQRHLAAHLVPARETDLPRPEVHRRDHHAIAARDGVLEVVQVVHVDPRRQVGSSRRHLHHVHPAVGEVADVAAHQVLERPVADGGNDVAEVVAQAVEAARHGGQQRVGGTVAEPVRHRLRERTDQGLGASVGVVRQHRIARNPLAGARLHRHVAGLRQRRRLPSRPAVNSSRVWRVPPPQLRAARRRRGRCAALPRSRRRR